MKLVLLDRDGVINENRADYVKSPGELVLIPGAGAAVARLNREGIRVAVCTNQACVGRGIINAERLEQIHAHLRTLLAREGARLDALFVCAHAPHDRCDCRKPEPGLLREALRRFGADAAETPMIGDAVRDLQAARTVGCPRHLVRTGHGAEAQAGGIPHDVLPVAVHDDLAAAVEALLDRSAAR